MPISRDEFEGRLMDLEAELRQLRGTTVREPLGRSSISIVRDAQLTATLNAASAIKDGSTTAGAKFLVPDPDNAGDLKDGDSFTVTNRSLDLTGLANDYIVVAKIGTEWRVVWIDC